MATDVTPPTGEDGDADGTPADTRTKLVWDVLVFQLKLAADGLRDVVLVPISLVAAVAGIVAGGSRPSRFLRQVMQFGRRTEIWINLFGYRKHAATSDAMLKPFEERFLDRAQQHPLVQRAERELGRAGRSSPERRDTDTDDA